MVIRKSELSENSFAGLNVATTGRIEDLKVSDSRFLKNDGPGVRIATLRGQTRFVRPPVVPAPGLFLDSRYKDVSISDCQFIDNAPTGVQVLLGKEAAKAQVIGISITKNLFRDASPSGKKRMAAGVTLERAGGNLGPVLISGNSFENLSTGVLGTAGVEPVKNLKTLEAENTFKGIQTAQQLVEGGQ
jgi:hypothetical protein